MLNPNPAKFDFLTVYYVGPCIHTTQAYNAEININSYPRYEEAVEQYGRVTTGHSQGDESKTHVCDHCGARFHHGVLYLERDSGKLYQIGHQCSDSTFSCADKAELIRKRIEKAAKISKRSEQWKRLGFEKFLARVNENESLMMACDFVDENENQIDEASKNDSIMMDILGKMKRFGNWSDKQEAFFLKLARQFTDRITGVNPEQEEKKDEKQPIPSDLLEGRHQITGTIVSIKYSEEWDQYKITVKEDRGFLVWGSLSSRISKVDVERGTKVTFRAGIVKSDRDDCFGFFKRPHGMEILPQE